MTKQDPLGAQRPTNRWAAPSMTMATTVVVTLIGWNSQAQLEARAAADPKVLAQQILDSPKITLLTTHTSGVADAANAKANIVDASNGHDAKRSAYGSAPGGTVKLKATLLQGMLDVAATYEYRVTEVAGGDHMNALSRHYKGVAFDVDRIDGQAVNASHPTYKQFMQKCKDLGATEVLGPGDAGHPTHVHAAWPPTG